MAIPREISRNISDERIALIESLPRPMRMSNPALLRVLYYLGGMAEYFGDEEPILNEVFEGAIDVVRRGRLL